MYILYGVSKACKLKLRQATSQNEHTPHPPMLDIKSIQLLFDSTSNEMTFLLIVAQE